MNEIEKDVKKKYKSFFQRLLGFECMPARMWICIMMFTATWMAYTCRLQLSVIINVMQDQRGNPQNQTRDLWDISSNVSIPDYYALEVRKWSVFAFGLGNVPGNLVGGTLTLNVGARALIFWTSLIAAIASILTPIAVNAHWYLLLLSRFIVGLMGGVVFPGCHALVSAWAPPAEKSRFVWSLLGGTAGSVIIFPVLTVLSARVGWEMAWIIPSIIYIVWCGLWLIWAYNIPSDHPFISEEEKAYITASQAGLGREENLKVKDMPLASIFTSIPFISLIICHFGNMYLLFFYQNYILTYLSKARGASIEKGGLLSAGPWLCRVVFGFFFSWIGDIIKKKEYVSLTVFRKTATIFSHLIPGICLIFVGHISDLAFATVLICLALGCNGAASIANLTNNQDLSPNYAGFLYGIMNFFGTMSGVVLPFIVEPFLKGAGENDPESWQKVFYSGGAVCIISMIVFVIGGSAEVQKWNSPNA